MNTLNPSILDTKEVGFQDFNLVDKNVRTCVVGDEIYFKAADVCRAFQLGDVDKEMKKLRVRIENTNSAIKNAEICANSMPPQNGGASTVPRIGAKKIIDTAQGNGGEQEVNYINEPAMYYLASRGKSEACLLFTWWLFSEVIPSIRKKGFYVKSQLNQD